MTGPRIDLDRLRADVEALAAIGRAPSGGLNRPAYSQAFEEARAWIGGRMEAAGIDVREDAVGNVIGRLGEAPASVVSGSHIDTVPDGGPLDGALGVVAALECARVLAQSGERRRHALEVVAFADEEGRYKSCLGSRAMAGTISTEEVAAARAFDGTTLAEALRRVGLNAGRVAEAARPPEAFAAFVELHIEQGPVLERIGVPIGVVQSIVGLVRSDITFHGEPDHAGTTPMDMRKDAFMGAAAYAVEARAMVLERGTADVRLTFGVIESKPQVANIVPFETRLRQVIRDVSAESLDSLVAESHALAGRVAERFGLRLTIEKGFHNGPAPMSQEVQSHIREACAGLGLASHDMPSGAGHDAQILAAVTPAGMIFVPSRGGRSHRPDEWTEWPAIERGANVLLHTLIGLLG